MCLPECCSSRLIRLLSVSALLFLPHASVFAESESGPSQEEKLYSPPVRNPSKNVYWGDTHLHTVLSADAYIADTRLTAHDSYRFARGESVQVDNGMDVKLRRPLDFLAVSDHAEYLGVLSKLQDPGPEIASWPLGKRWAQYLRDRNITDFAPEFGEGSQSDAPEYQAPEIVRETGWQDYAATADQYNEPGLFTAFVAYEWTSMVSGDNLHRVVLYKDSADVATQMLPFSAQDSTDPEDLWDALASYEAKTGGEVLAIPHNGNVSNGIMFAPERMSGKPIDENYAAMRSRWEPIYEVTQVKGDGETHPYLSPDDEFADFETWDEANINMTAEKKPEMLQYEYARSAFLEGLRHEENVGENPFKFGLIGSTDSHTAVSTTTEDNFFGKFPPSSPRAERASDQMFDIFQENWQLGASGLAAVWAEENTREALFEAAKRREVYATTGSRIQVRFFGGWDFNQKDLVHPNYADVAYKKGVPMGGDLTRADHRKAPSFLVVAAKDPDGANLDRAQVVKGWLDEDGRTHEKVYDVALSDGRKVNRRSGKAPAVGSTVDLEDASYTNDIGDSELAVAWVDPDFDPDQRAFYYVRVLEIPKPRWTAYDAAFFEVDMPEHVRMVIQDRAYTSPIWYTP